MSIHVTSDGDTYWLECFTDDNDSEDGDLIGPVEVGDCWDDLAAMVVAHRSAHGCSLATTSLDPGTREYVHWAVAYGCPSGDPNEAAGVLEYDDEEEAREHLQWVHDSFLARRTVTSTRWERVDAGTPAPGEGNQ